MMLLPNRILAKTVEIHHQYGSPFGQLYLDSALLIIHSCNTFYWYPYCERAKLQHCQPSRPFSWLEMDAVYKLGNYTLVSTTLCPQSDDLDKQPITVTGFAL